jgi:hypothetical protein
MSTTPIKADLFQPLLPATQCNVEQKQKERQMDKRSRLVHYQQKI